MRRCAAHPHTVALKEARFNAVYPKRNGEPVVSGGMERFHVCRACFIFFRAPPFPKLVNGGGENMRFPRRFCRCLPARFFVLLESTRSMITRSMIARQEIVGRRPACKLLLEQPALHVRLRA